MTNVAEGAMARERDRPVQSLEVFPPEAISLNAHNDLLNHIRHLNEREANRRALTGLSLPENYINGDMWILVALRVRTNPFLQYVAVLHSSRRQTNDRSILSFIAQHLRGPGNRDNKLMLVKNVQVVKVAEKVIPSWIWLESFDCSSEIGLQRCYLLHSPRLSRSVFPERETASPGGIPR